MTVRSCLRLSRAGLAPFTALAWTAWQRSSVQHVPAPEHEHAER